VPVPQEETFRAEVAGWLAANLAGEFAVLVGSGAAWLWPLDPN